MSEENGTSDFLKKMDQMPEMVLSQEEIQDLVDLCEDPEKVNISELAVSRKFTTFCSGFWSAYPDEFDHPDDADTEIAPYRTSILVVCDGDEGFIVHKISDFSNATAHTFLTGRWLDHITAGELMVYADGLYDLSLEVEEAAEGYQPGNIPSALNCLKH